MNQILNSTGMDVVREKNKKKNFDLTFNLNDLSEGEKIIKHLESQLNLEIMKGEMLDSQIEKSI